MSNLTGAKQSPRIVAGSLYFYEGDTFGIDLHLDIKDQDCTPVEFSPGDSLDIKIRNRSGEVIHSEVIQYGGELRVTFGEELTGKMPRGKYTMTISMHHGGFRGTVTHETMIEVS